MNEPTPQRPEASEKLKRLFERLCQKPAGSCIGVHEMVPIFEIMEISAPETESS